jgi:hypothetical protein
MPAKSEFPGTGDTGNGISPNMQSQGEWIRSVKSGGCTACHALGTKATREIPTARGPFPTTAAAWDRRLKSGQAGGQMSNQLNQFGRARVLKMFADWTDQIRAGALPPAPARPQGIERNVVITQWDWADPKAYLHDVVSTDRRNPRVNANGPVYGALELSADYVPVLDPVAHSASEVPLTVRDPNTPPTNPAMPEPSPYWDDEVIWTSKNNVHNPMLDHRGRVWLTSAVRPSANPPECKEGSSHPSAKLYPVANAGRHLAVYDPATKKLTHISTCFGTHHLMFAEDANHTLWTSHVDDDTAALQRRENAGRPVEDVLDVGGVRQHGDDASGCCRHLRRRIRPARAGCDELVDRWPAAAVDDERVSRLQQVERHGPSHQAQSDEADCVHGEQYLRSSRFLVPGSPFWFMVRGSWVRGSQVRVHGSRFTVRRSRFGVPGFRGSGFGVRGSGFGVRALCCCRYTHCGRPNHEVSNPEP